MFSQCFSLELLNNSLQSMFFKVNDTTNVIKSSLTNCKIQTSLEEF